ncbi:MAG: aromatic amino acid DMT transporter YddG [Lewinellaceae bacterium]|nr:aromatic amino acid DMT transporter YddG [Lewinellaceae bacterium]
MRLNKYTLFGFLAVFLWSATVALVRSISEQLGPVTAGAAVYLTGGILACTYWWSQNKFVFSKERFPVKYFFSTGSLFLIYTLNLFLALGLAKDRIQAIELGLVNYLWPGLTILLSLLIFSRKVTLGLIPGTLLAFVGIFLVLIPSGNFSWPVFLQHIIDNPIAYFCGLIAAFSWAFYSNLTRLWKSVEDAGYVPFYILITGVFLLLLSMVFPEKSQWGWGVLGEVLFLSFTTVLAYAFWEMSMQKGDIALVLPFTYLTPLFSTLVSSVYLGVFPDARLWVGCIALVTGSFISWKSMR